MYTSGYGLESSSSSSYKYVVTVPRTSHQFSSLTELLPALPNSATAMSQFGFYIETEEQLRNALQRWKNFSFNANYIKLHDAVTSINTDNRLVDGRHQYAPRWLVRLPDLTVCHILIVITTQLVRRGTRREAVFHTVGLWRWNSNLETGNFVPPGQTAPARLSEQRM